MLGNPDLRTLHIIVLFLLILKCRTLFTTPSQLESAKMLLIQYKTNQIPSMTPELWRSKKIVDSTLHPDTGQPVLLPFRMSCFVLSNLVVTAGMLTPNLGTRGIVAWQFTNQSLNVAINASNANKSSPLTTKSLLTNYLLAVSASCTVAVGLNALVPRLRGLSQTTKTVLRRLVPFAAVASAGALNVFLMRGEELRRGIDIYPVRRDMAIRDNKRDEEDDARQSLGKSKKAALQGVGETAASRVINATPIMVIPPLILVALQRRSKWLQTRPRMVLPLNLSLIFTTSVFALPLALAIFPQRRTVKLGRLEEELYKDQNEEMEVWFNRGI